MPLECTNFNKALKICNIILRNYSEECPNPVGKYLYKINFKDSRSISNEVVVYLLLVFVHRGVARFMFKVSNKKSNMLNLVKYDRISVSLQF